MMFELYPGNYQISFINFQRYYNISVFRKTYYKGFASLIIAFTFFTFHQSNAKTNGDSLEIKFFKGSWSELLGKADKEDKLIFVDFYTTWCAPCKWMEKNVFNDPDVIKYFNENYVSKRIDAEKQELELVGQTGIEAYPTLVIFNSLGVEMLRHEGALKASDLIEFGDKVRSFPKVRDAFYDNKDNLGNLVTYLELFQNIDPESAGKLASEKISTLSEEEYRSKEGWYLLSNFVHYIDKESIDYVVSNAEYFHDEYPEFGDFMATLYDNLITEAVESADTSKIANAVAYEIKVRKQLDMMEMPEEYYFDEALSQYYLAAGDLNDYFNVYKILVKEYHFSDWMFLSENAISHSDAFFDDATKMGIIQSWTIRAMDLENNYYTNFAHSYTWYSQEKYELAEEFAKVAYSLCDDDTLKEELETYVAEIQGKM